MDLFNFFSTPEKFFSAQATKKGEICPGGRDKNAGGNWEEKKWALDKSPHLEGYYTEMEQA